MYKRIVLFFIFLGYAFGAFAQESDTTKVENESGEVPVISYSLSPKQYKIEDIKVTGVKTYYDDFVLIGFSGLSVGDMITVPGEEITAAVNRFWKHGLFSDVKILASKIQDDKVWLEIRLKQRPRISEVNYNGIKKGEREDLEAKLNLKKGFQITPNLIDRAKIVIQKFFDGKGFKNVDVQIVQKDDVSKEGEVIVDINIDKNEKTKINQIIFTGNSMLRDADLKKAMKKTNEKFAWKRWKTSIKEMFSTKKFVTEEYEKDKKNIIDKYNELGYRDAVLLADSVINHDEKTVDVYLSISEGQKYYLKDINFVGNTQYPTDQLMAILGMKPGEVYNQKKLNERLTTDDDAVSNIYYNNGYLFFGADPVEVEVENDSIALEIRIQEGPQATINRIIINGNDRLYEDIVRRELRTKPGMLFSREDLIRSVRELAQMGHFDPENMNPNPVPDSDNGTVDIQYNLVSKANDQVEFSAGWGQTGVIGKLSLKFTNFSMKNFLNPSTYKGIIPQGEGQTLTLSGQTNGRYYQAYSVSFMDPWFGGKRPNTLSVSAYFSMQTDVSSNFLSRSSYGMNPYYGMYGNSMYGNSMYGNSMYGNSMYGGNYELAYDPDKSIKMLGLSVGYGKRLNWPDDYFQFMLTLNYQLYMMKDWAYFLVQNGNSHNVNMELMLQRNSVDNPLYSRRGSQFSVSVSATPPYSLWDGKDYASMADTDQGKFKLIEYHKWKFKAKIFSPLAPLTVKRTPVLMSRVEYGFLGYYNKNKRSPFETFYMGGDGMSGYSTMYANETIGLRGYENGSLAGNNGYNSYAYAYSRLAMELRYPFLLEPTSTIYGLAFVEAGNAWQNLKDFSPFDLKRSAGVGVRIFLPMIGMMGIDWAYGFDKVNGQRNAGGSNFHFIIGQEF
ncbi:BamA/OMP85 family outer membrane protein [Macellibacteroides fermentans]|uniref:BamA/OMP85 family outer membrane protein n=1 Tax=Macellibacteroides fermentans TaxID=879969 RepID=UPI00406D0743